MNNNFQLPKINCFCIRHPTFYISHFFFYHIHVVDELTLQICFNIVCSATGEWYLVLLTVSISNLKNIGLSKLKQFCKYSNDCEV